MINLAEFGTGSAKPFPDEFRPVAKYIPAMDCLIYLREDVSYRAIRLDQYRTVLLHPQEDRPVGVKLKGLSFVINKTRAVLKSVGIDTTQFKLITLWEMALTDDGDDAVAQADAERKRLYAQRARALVESDDIPVAPPELPLVA